MLQEEVKKRLEKQGWDNVYYELPAVTATKEVRGYNLDFSFTETPLYGSLLTLVVYKTLDKRNPSWVYTTTGLDCYNLDTELSKVERVLRVFERECGEGWGIDQQELVALLKEELHN